MGPMSDKEFQAEMDMNVLKEAEQIERNAKRLNNAKQHARAKAQELQQFAADSDDEMGCDERMVRDGYTKL